MKKIINKSSMQFTAVPGLAIFSSIDEAKDGDVIISREITTYTRVGNSLDPKVERKFELYPTI